MAERTLVSRPTLRRLESGDLSVGLAVLVQELQVLGMEADLDHLAGDDELGHELADARLPSRPRRSVERGLADQL
jgi:transcriptional regulator with XRE-family HTH domain